MEELAINGGKPIRETFLPYATQWIGEEERKEVLEVLNSNWLTTGPKVKQFEEEFARYVGAKYAIAVNSGTAALHCCVGALDINPGDEVITTPFTFLATANVIVYRGGIPVLVDIDERTYNINPEEIRKKITSKTKAIIPVHYGGHPCEMDKIKKIAEEYNLKIIEDAAHALSAEYKGKKIGCLSDLSIFSFHPVKNITTAEGGIITTNNEKLAKLCIMHRTHGITKEAMQRYGKTADWMYDMQRLGHRYNMAEFQAALGIAQLRKIEKFQKRREEIVAQYNEGFSKIPELILPTVRNEVKSSWHLYPIRIKEELLSANRNEIIKAFKAENIGVNVHYIPIHFHSYYQNNYKFKKGDFPITEHIYNSIITLPLFPKMSNQDIQNVIDAVTKIINYYKKNKNTTKIDKENNVLDIIEGERLLLVPFTEKHLQDPQYLNWLRNKEVMRYARDNYDEETTLEEVKDYVINLIKNKDEMFFAIELKKERKFIGTFRIAYINWEAKRADLGILIGDKSQWGKGLATEAYKHVINFCFKKLGLNKVTLGCKEPNKSMIKVAQKLGFTQEGYFREQNFIEGKRTGHYYFGLLKKEHEELKKVNKNDTPH